MVRLGLAGMGLGLAALVIGPAAFGAAGYIAAIVVVTVHYALFQAANNTAVMADVSTVDRGVISGMLSLSRNLGLITGASAMGAVFAGASARADILAPYSEAATTGMQTTFTLAAALMAVSLALTIGGGRWASKRPV